jgi:hypothetical protein
MSNSNSKPPRAFISYSWSSLAHEAFIKELATDLTEYGIHVVYDKWDLQEGDDKYAFMEQMVTDEAIDKVILVCDREYADKADARKGGVGAETQIVSKEVYEKVGGGDSPRRFVAIATELDDHGEAYLPK